MNVQCQQCATAYAVADDKVAGRVMKLRCRKCGEAIRVDGTALDAGGGHAQGEARPTSPPPSDGATWHIAIGDSTQGPYTLDELREYYAQGAILLDTLVFCEGWSEWRTAGEVDELRPRPSAPPARSVRPAPPAPGFGQVSMGSDPFEERLAASPRVSAQQMMTPGATESTVQFSLDQMRALSSGAPVATMPIAVSSMPAGHASGDGSGLIDVRQLAELHAQMSASTTPSIEERSSGLLPTSNYAHTLSPLSLPLAPQRTAPQGLDGRTKLIAGLAALGMVVAGGVAVFAILRAPVPGPALASAAMPTGATTGPNTLAAEPSAPAVAEAEAPAAEADKPATEEPAAAADDDDEQAAVASRDTERSSHSRGRAGKHKASKKDRSEGGDKGKRKGKESASSVDDVLESEPVAKADKPAKAEKESEKSDKALEDLLGEPVKKPKGASPSIDDLLDGAVAGKKSSPKAEEPKADSSLPQSPSRESMVASLGKAAAKAKKCGESGVAKAALKVGGNGRVMSVNVTGVEGAAGTCIEKAFRATSFPRFQKDSIDVAFPVKLGG